jgi:hypothetical protein
MPSLAQVGGRRRAARANVFDVLGLTHAVGYGKIKPQTGNIGTLGLHGQEGAHRQGKFPGVNSTDPSPTIVYM